MLASGRAGPFLDGLTHHTRSRLDAHLETAVLKGGDTLIEPGQPIDYMHFLKGGLATLTCGTSGRAAAVALIGFEGFTGHCLLLGRKQSPCRTLMQIGGEAWRIRADVLMRLADEDASLRLALLHGVDDLLQQITDVALANAQLTVEVRLARLLLMISQRLADPVIPLTHDRIAIMLGCRRAGVTMGMHLLEGEKAIRAMRAKIVVRDYARLRQLAQDWRAPYGEADAPPKHPAPAPRPETMP